MPKPDLNGILKHYPKPWIIECDTDGCFVVTSLAKYDGVRTVIASSRFPFLARAIAALADVEPVKKPGKRGEK